MTCRDSPEVPRGARARLPARHRPSPPSISERDFVEAEGYQPGTALELRVLRNGVQIGSASGTTNDAGIVEVNHPGGSCWDGSTPDIIGGDVVQVVETARTTTAEEFGESTATQHVTAQHAYLEGNTVVVKGTASDGKGGRLPIDMFEQRIVNPAFTDSDIGRRDIRAVADGSGHGTLAYDDASSPHWTARYSGALFDEEVRQLALEGQTRVLAWQLFDPAGEGGLGSRQGLTIYEEDEISGPGMGDCPASASWAVTGSSPKAVNLATQNQDLTITGTSHGITSVTVSLDDGDPATAPLTADATPSGTGTDAMGRPDLVGHVPVGGGARPQRRHADRVGDLHPG